jgi:hypothetical protein
MTNRDSASVPLDDLEVPPVPSVPVSISGPPVTPAQRIAFYSPEGREVFIREWATGLATSYLGGHCRRFLAETGGPQGAARHSKYAF